MTFSLLLWIALAFALWSLESMWLSAAPKARRAAKWALLTIAAAVLVPERGAVISPGSQIFELFLQKEESEASNISDRLNTG